MARVFSGIQPSGDIHLGNYIGAIRQFVRDQDEHDCFFCVVDLHAITVPQDPEALRHATLELCAVYLASGISPDKATLFVQSHVHQHAELSWILGATATAFGELRRMTQFKDKAGSSEAVGFGLFAYPVLMAADILLYQAERVPIGDDQRQHLELARDIAQRFNGRFGDTFVVPSGVFPAAGARVMDLQNPTAKMSKSAESPQGVVRLTDDPEVIRKKIRSAVTDTGREIVAREDKPGISNLLDICSALAGRSVSELEAAYEGKGYGEFKSDVADTVIDALAPIQQRYREYMQDRGELARVLEQGAQKAQAVAEKTMASVIERLGIVPRGR